jgi:hypothetical protein
MSLNNLGEINVKCDRQANDVQSFTILENCGYFASTQYKVSYLTTIF